MVRWHKPVFAVECKSGDRALSRNIAYFSERSNIPVFYQVHRRTADVEYPDSRARVLPLTSLARILEI